MSHKKSHDLLVLSGTFILAIALHVGGIFLLKDMEVTFSGISQSGLDQLTHQEETQTEEELCDLEEELATLFNQIAETENDDFHEPELLEEAEEDEILEPMTFDDMAPLSVEDTLPELQETELSFDDLPEIVDLPTDDVAIETGVQVDDTFTEQLMSATDQMQGYAALDAPTFDDGDENFFAAGKRRLDAELEGMGANQAALSGGRVGNPARANIASSQDFDLRVSYAPNEDQGGYVFQIELLPKRNVRFRRISHNMFFVLDRSASIDKDRYEKSKAAVAAALDYLEADDTFNILVFDKKVVKLAESNLTANSANIERGKQWLANTKHGGIFASTELYSSLDNIVPKAVRDTEVNTAILFSDGDTLLKQQAQRRSIGSWTQRNNGKVSLFSVAAGKNNNLALLELLSAFNKGRLVYCQSHDDIPKLLTNLVKAIRNPIGKEIVLTAACDDPSVKITLYPRRQRLPELYEDTPYVIYGNTNKLRDFHVFVQGKYYQRWLDIRHKVSFSDAKPAALTIERKWAMHKAFDHYERYMADGNSQHVKEGNAFLTPFNVKPAFR